MGGTGRSDVELLAAHRGGDSNAFGELVDRHSRRLWGTAVRTLGDVEDAADTVQEALLSAYRGVHRFRGDAAVGTWLHRIVVNACLDRIRCRRVRHTMPWPDRDVAGRTDHATDLATRLDIGSALATLPVEQRIAIVLVDVQGTPVAEAAAVLGVAVGTVKSRCARGRVRLATLLGHLREDTP